MDRTPQHQTRALRRLPTGVTLVTAAALAVATVYASPDMPPQSGAKMFSNPSGVIGIVGMNDADADNPFFRELGTNGRSCVTCHRPAQGWSITPADLRERFSRTDGFDPVFRVNDGSNCEGADVSTAARRRQAFSLLLQKGLIRIGIEVPAGAE